VVIVVVCSWGLSLLFSFTCWNSYKRSQPTHLYCTQCSTLQPPYQHRYPPLPHTAERLGILEPGDQPAVLAPPILQSSHDSYSAFPRTGYGEALVPVSSHREEELDHDTTISRSFRSARKRSSGIERSLNRSTAGLRNDGKEQQQLTLNERFGTISNPASHNHNSTNASAKSSSSSQSKLSQVRVLTSPPPSEQDQALTRTPSNALKSTRKSFHSNISKRSIKSLWGARKEKLSNSSHVLTSKSYGGARKKTNTKENEHEALTSETNLETSDEDVFISQKPRTGEQLGQHFTTPVNPELVQRQFSQEVMLTHSEWSNPKKERQVGSPGNTATADYFIKQQTPQLLDIDLGKPGEQVRSAMVSRVNTQVRRKVSSSAPTRQSGGDKAQGHHNHRLLSVKSRHAYKPGYSESDLASQSEDETRRQNWDRRGALELPPTQGLTPGSGLDLTPPVLDLSQVLPDPPSVVPSCETSTLSTDPSPLQYSSVSFSPSDMSLVVSPSMPATQYASSQSSHPVSLDWDNYASDPQFHHHSFYGNSNSVV